MPAEIDDAGLAKEFQECMASSKDAHMQISAEMPEEAQYVVNFAYRYPYFLR